MAAATRMSLTRRCGGICSTTQLVFTTQCASLLLCPPSATAGVYSSLLSPGAALLELCASRHSHLPLGLGLSRVVAQGMNDQELAGNAALSQWWVQVRGGSTEQGG
jgi:hypothetical protein